MGCGTSIHADSAGSNTDEESIKEELEDVKKMIRPSIISLRPPKDFNDDLSSDGCSVGSNEDEEHSPSSMEYLCHTDISLDWLLARLADKLSCHEEEKPQWIGERLNRPHGDERETSTVLRITFGWESEELPRSVVLKLAIAKDQRDDDWGRTHYNMFKRECNAYEWVSKYPKIVAPKIIHIKKHSSESGSGVIVMGDLSDTAQQGDPYRGLTIDTTKELLKALALLHAQSIRQSGWTTTIPDIPISYLKIAAPSYKETSEFFELLDVAHSRFTTLEKYFSLDYLHDMVTYNSKDENPLPRVLVHGEPFAENIFTQAGELVGLIDWTVCHAGRIGEDIAKALLWNLSLRDRLENTLSLLEHYHSNLVRYAGDDVTISLDVVRSEFERFVPTATVMYLKKVMEKRNRDDFEVLADRAKGLIENTYLTFKMAEQ